jgi:hypothetical protein
VAHARWFEHEFARAIKDRIKPARVVELKPIPPAEDPHLPILERTCKATETLIQMMDEQTKAVAVMAEGAAATAIEALTAKLDEQGAKIDSLNGIMARHEQGVVCLTQTIDRLASSINEHMGNVAKLQAETLRVLHEILALLLDAQRGLGVDGEPKHGRAGAKGTASRPG